MSPSESPSPIATPSTVASESPIAVAIVVPVHDEAELLERCLTALTAAVGVAQRAHPGLAVATVVVLDACSDSSAAIAERWPVRTVTVDARSVGTARRVGVGTALALVAGAAPGAAARRDETIWIATTDADSAVPANWLVHQLELMTAGADVVLGTVKPDFGDLTIEHAAHWTATHPRGRPAGNVHGANLGIRASVYLAAGGFADRDEHEDVELVRAATALGAVVRASDENEVITSGRFAGRTPGGYARFVHETHLRISGLTDAMSPER